MKKLKQMLEAYRNGDRQYPTYAELIALCAEDEPHVEPVHDFGEEA